VPLNRDQERRPLSLYTPPPSACTINAMLTSSGHYRMVHSVRTDDETGGACPAFFSGPPLLSTFAFS
jgi:hypothetical protein